MTRLLIVFLLSPALAAGVFLQDAEHAPEPSPVVVSGLAPGVYLSAPDLVEAAPVAAGLDDLDAPETAALGAALLYAIEWSRR